MRDSLLLRVLRLFVGPFGAIKRSEFFFAAVVLGLCGLWIARFGQVDMILGPLPHFDDMDLLVLSFAALAIAVSCLFVVAKRLRDLDYSGAHAFWLAFVATAALFPGRGLPAWQFAAMCIAGLVVAWLLITPTSVAQRFYEGRAT